MTPLRFQHLTLTDLPADTRAWIEGRQPDIPRARSLPWMMIGALGAIVTAVTAALLVAGVRSFSRPDNWVPLLVVLLIVGIPGAYVIVRDWRRNQVGLANGRTLGVHLSPDAAFWRDDLTRVLVIPRGSLQRMHLTVLRAKLGLFPHRLIISDASGQVIEITDVDLPTLWHALRAQNPEATATYAPELEDQMFPRRRASPSTDAPPEPKTAPTAETTIWRARPSVDLTVLTEAPDVPAPPPPPPTSETIDWFAVREYFRALFASQGIEARWLGEQPTGVTPVYLNRPLVVQWQTLAPIAKAIEGTVGHELANALASGRETEWVSLRQIDLGDWTDISVDD